MPGNRNEALGKPGASVLSVPARDAIGKAGVPVWGFDLPIDEFSSGVYSRRLS